MNFCPAYTSTIVTACYWKTEEDMNNFKEPEKMLKLELMNKYNFSR